jgi:hypothetical protein
VTRTWKLKGVGTSNNRFCDIRYSLTNSRCSSGLYTRCPGLETYTVGARILFKQNILTRQRSNLPDWWPG